MMPLLLLLVVCLFPNLVMAQLWSNQIASTRATDWTQDGGPGVRGGIPNRTNYCYGPGGALGPAIPAYGGTTDTINNAIRDCSNLRLTGGGVVLLGPGLFTLTGSIHFDLSSNYPTSPAQNVTLRGSGPDQTELRWNVLAPTGNCLDNCLMGMNSGLVPTAACEHATPQNQNRVNWTAGYAAGTTIITLSNTAGNGPQPRQLAPGMVIMLDQLNTPADNTHFNTYAPFNGDNNVYGHALPPGQPTLECLGNSVDGSRCVLEYHEVVSVNGNQVTIRPAIAYPYWNFEGTSVDQPQAWWCGNALETMSGNGIESLYINNQTPQWQTPQLFRGLIQIAGCHNCWVKNIKSNRSSASHIYMFDASNIEIRDSYFFANDHPLNCASGSLGIVTYGIDEASAGLLKLENNIFQQLCAPSMMQPCFFCIVGYNYYVGNYPQIDSNNLYWTFNTNGMNHVASSFMILQEGNDGTQANMDHGTAHGYGAGFFTLFRNRFSGYQAVSTVGGPSPLPIASVKIGSMNRFVNIIGNILGDPHQIGVFGNKSQQVWQYQSSPTLAGSAPYSDDGYIFTIGWSGYSCQNLNCPQPNLPENPDDPITFNSLLRWANFDYISNRTRFCTKASTPAYCTAGSEIPTDNFDLNPATTLPPSYYLSSKPSWFGSTPWPAIGPDVTGGYDSSGHTSSLPARNCYLNVMRGPADGTGSILTFNADSCYGGSLPDTTPPAAPTGVTISKVMN